MAPLQQYQIAFTASLLDGDLPPPVEIDAAARLAIHRNNRHASLVAVLEARYPVIRRLVGDEFFRALASAFLRQQPPRSPVLARYGDGFAAFLRAFEPVQEMPYLPDIALLEWARNLAYHAADAPTASIADLAALPEAALASTQLVLHPAASLVVSDYPVFSLWQTNTHDTEVQAIGADRDGETVLITRPALDVLVTALPNSGAKFFAALRQSLTLGQAFETIDTADDVARLLSILFAAGAIARVVSPS